MEEPFFFFWMESALIIKANGLCLLNTYYGVGTGFKCSISFNRNNFIIFLIYRSGNKGSEKLCNLVTHQEEMDLEFEARKAYTQAHTFN